MNLRWCAGLCHGCAGEGAADPGEVGGAHDAEGQRQEGRLLALWG
jgi:hypothetical protein